jgi:hypothetical protein
MFELNVIAGFGVLGYMLYKLFKFNKEFRKQLDLDK